MSLLWNTASRSLLRPVIQVAEQQSYFMLTGLRFKTSLKTVSGVKKRFRLRGSGSIKRNRSGRSHNTGYKTRQRVNHLGSSTGVQGKKMEQRIRKLLGCY